MVTKTHSRAPLWQTPDALWHQIAPVLGPDKPPGTVGRPATPNRILFDALIFILRSGCPWQALPRPAYPPARRCMVGSARGSNKACFSGHGRPCCTTMIGKWAWRGNGKPLMG